MSLVLIVDDEFGVADVLQALLEDEGHQVMTAINGRVALERVGEERPDLIITDYMMPVMDGPAFVAAVMKQPALKSVPVIVMSSMPETAVAERISTYAAYLRKPFRVNDVLVLLEKLLPHPPSQ